jgi:sugar phosphate isomerase/epimerase
MYLSLMMSVLGHLELDAALDQLQRFGIPAAEVGTGGYPGDRHCRPAELLADAGALAGFQRSFSERDLRISAFACHGNPLHPDPKIADEHHRVFQDTVRLAERLDVDKLVLFSGCPGGSPTAAEPNWVTCAWPTDYLRILQWQWDERVIPYWREQAAFAADHGITRLAFEMHPGFVVYNPATLLRLRDAVGPQIGANLDPSHLIWQGIDAVVAVRELGRAGALFHTHAKDTALNTDEIRRRGVLDTTSLADAANRSWLFRTVGYGHGELWWRQFISSLREVGYDDAVSIEHEDVLASPLEGVQKAVSLLRECIFTEPAAGAWWTD